MDGCKADENGKPSVDRNFRLCMICVDYSQMQRHQYLSATMNILRLRTTGLVRQERPAYLKPITRARQMT